MYDISQYFYEVKYFERVIYLLDYNSIIYDETKRNNDHKILDKTNIFTIQCFTHPSNKILFITAHGNITVQINIIFLWFNKKKYHFIFCFQCPYKIYKVLVVKLKKERI